MEISAIDEGELLFVEPCVRLIDLRKVKDPDDLVDLHDFTVVFRRPAEQTKIISHSFRNKPPALIFFDQRTLIAFAHLSRTILFQDQRNMSKYRKGFTQC